MGRAMLGDVYFVILNVDPNCVSACYLFLNKYHSFNIASLWQKDELIEIWESILADSINVRFFLFVFGGWGLSKFSSENTVLIFDYLGIAILAL